MLRPGRTGNLQLFPKEEASSRLVILLLARRYQSPRQCAAIIQIPSAFYQEETGTGRQRAILLGSMELSVIVESHLSIASLPLCLWLEMTSNFFTIPVQNQVTVHLSGLHRVARKGCVLCVLMHAPIHRIYCLSYWIQRQHTRMYIQRFLCLL